MSMLADFFDIRRENRGYFSGLEIEQHKGLCKDWMNQYPVLFLSLKDVDGTNFNNAFELLKFVLAQCCENHDYLLESNKISEQHKNLFNSVRNRTASVTDVQGFILVLTNMMQVFYNKSVILLLDEYDVPLDKAFQHGYYREMVTLIRGLFGEAFKTNDFLQFAVLAGCLRISKESIFTGLNNFKVYAANDLRYDEAFGFTNEEVKQLLADYYLEKHFAEVKEWYDGYHFGNADIYCPWDVINYVDDLVFDPQARPKSYWINSSGNDLVKRFIDKADMTTRDEIEELIAGHAVKKRIRMDLTYDEVDNTIDNVWSVLFTTGYLTREGREMDGIYRLIIPNKEVREVFVLQISEWFNRVVANDRASTEKINRGFLEGKTEDIQQELTHFLGESISVLDTKARNEEKEIIYHGILIGILKNNANWAVRSNRESGDGYEDILIKPKNPDTGIVIELKYARSFKELDQTCERALEQIKDRRYDEALREDGRNEVLAYGIAFWKKRCKVVVDKI